AFENLASYPRLLALGERQSRSGRPDIVIEPDLYDGLPQRQLVDHLSNHGWDADRRVGLAISYLTEQDIVLHRGGCVVVLRIEELDLRPRLRREIGPKHLPRLEQASLHRLVDNVEPVSCRDQLERQR